MSDIGSISSAQVARAVQLQAGRSAGSATSQVIPSSQNVSQGKPYVRAQEVRREPLEQAESLSGSDSRSAVEIEERLQEAMAKFNRSVNFRVDEATGMSVLTIRDRVTDEIIREFPAKEFLTLVARLEEMRGLFFEEVA